jgi:hypothetical protein
MSHINHSSKFFSTKKSANFKNNKQKNNSNLLVLNSNHLKIKMLVLLFFDAHFLGPMKKC